MTTVIIPMKEKNERLPGKNTKILNGKPLCYYLLKTLSEMSVIDKIICDIDGESIIEVVKKLFLPKVETEVRPSIYCDPMLGGDKLLERFVNIQDEIYLQCHVTSPFLSKETIKKGIELIENKKYESVFSVTRLQQRVWSYDMKPLNHEPAGPILRTQDLNPVLMENGAFFAFRGSYYLKNQKRNNIDSFPLELNFPETIDIDEFYDFKMASMVLI